MLVTIIWITVFYASSICYDRDAALRDAFTCVSRALLETNAEHWLVNGSLLGATRLGHFVLWDGEIDLAFVSESVSTAVSFVQNISDYCSHIGELTRSTLTDESPGVWKLCSNRVCVELIEYIKKGEDFFSAFGSVSSSATLPLVTCTLAGISTFCPRDGSTYLQHAFGEFWATAPLTSLF